VTDARLTSSKLLSDPQWLSAQAHVSWGKEVQLLKHLGLQDGMSILELGCGPGFVTELLLDSFPASKLTAVDLDPAMTELARKRLAKHIPHKVEILQESTGSTSLADESFDFAIARYLFQHLGAPETTLEETSRLLKSGGTLAIADIDDDLGGIIDGGLPSFSTLMNRLRGLQSKRGGNPHIGRKLWRLLRDARFERLTLDAILTHSDELGLEPFLPQYHPDRYQSLLSTEGGVSQEEWEQYRREYDLFITSKTAYIMSLIFVASGRKPPNTSA